jgi:hypothetical protein
MFKNETILENPFISCEVVRTTVLTFMRLLVTVTHGNRITVGSRGAVSIIPTAKVLG